MYENEITVFTQNENDLTKKISQKEKTVNETAAQWNYPLFDENDDAYKFFFWAPPPFTFFWNFFSKKDNITSWTKWDPIRNYNNHGNMMIAKVTPTINSKVDSSTNNISIHFSSPVFLSNGNITIYKASDNNLRQSVSANSEYCTLSNDGKVAYIRIVNGTFSEHGEKYYVRMDSNFVKTRSFNNEALRGIESNVWLLESEEDLWNQFKLPINAAMVVFAIICLFSHILSYKLHSKKFEAINSAILRLGLIIPNFILSILFIVYYSNDVPNLHLPSVFFFSASLFINCCIAIYTVYNGINDPVVGGEFKEWVNHNRNLATVLTILASTDYEYLTILKDAPILTKVTIDYRYLTIIKDVTKEEIDEYLKILKDVPVSDESDKSDKINQINILKSLKDVLPRIDESNESGESDESDENKQIKNMIKQIITFRQIFRYAIICGAFFDIFFRNIPLIVIQVIYYQSVVKYYSLVPYLLLITCCLKIFMIIIRCMYKRALLYIFQRELRDSICGKYGKCKKCKQYNTSPVWCRNCDPKKETLVWKIDDKVIEEAIKNFQRKATEYDKVIEWMPYYDLTKHREIKWVPIEEQGEDKEKLYLTMATWTKGIRTIEYESGRYIRSPRIKSCVDLIKLGSSQTNSVITKFEEMMKENHKIYGLTQDVKTKQYMIVLDYYYYKRNEEYGKCKQCRRYNTNPVWCQSCDPSKESTRNSPLNDNDEINNCIKSFQLKAVEYDNFIEWIQYNDLAETIKNIEWIPMDGNKLQEIEEKSEQLDFFMASWKIRTTIKNESGEYTRSRNESRVDLIKLLNSQATISDFIKKLNEIMKENHKIYGITQDVKTEQYMIVLDYYYEKRIEEYGICEQCKRNNTNLEWCQSCDPSVIKNKSLSEDNEINKCIKEFQLKATAYEKIIEWIPYKNLSNTEEIGKGGFGTVYSAIWLDGKRTVEKIDGCYKRSRRLPYVVALKTFPGSKTDVSSVLKEFKSHMKCRLEGAELEMYGLTQNTKNNDYLMVFQYANKGNLRKFLRENFSELTWQKKLEQLEYMSNDLHQIHNAKFTHCDFHSGNILLNQNLDGKIKSYIADLGLSRQIGDESEDEIHGVMQYVAPEVLLGTQPSKETDIYGFGVIMAEITGINPFDGREVNTKLAKDICKGLRPEFASGTPECYKKLANECMNSDPANRPNALDINKEINVWLDKLASYDENEIKKQFLSADKTIKTLSIVPQMYSLHTKKINKQEILKELS